MPRIFRPSKRPLLVSIIAGIDACLAAIVIVYMIPLSIMAYFYHTYFSSELFFKLVVYATGLLVFSVGLFRNRHWAYVGRIVFGIVLLLNGLYGFLKGRDNVNILSLYDVLVVVFLLMLVKKKRRATRAFKKK